ncbi:thioredoxin family protein [Chromatium okenii]|jgi:small redox-active disulfide protein 2|uniref:Thioredoxin family protein n=1 Tax=Chromatium okenii TaxID=61644 RepID=A0A2S7XVU1_9GAMM|nr:thioredoxin family protein [Chromatium okenii]MBV5308829.1 thioredoxin family protein [Chromatium okenii]PQJ95382.1 thioredoxin family protein [Chromatium okenii]PQJ97608.1 thioredoxin family protein [Chromatium okenii]
MKNVKILGTGCRNCQTTRNLVEEVAKAKGVIIELEKVEKIEDIMRYRILATPGVVIDGVVVHSGGIPERGTVERWFE